jgi:hypothetical protein
MRRTVFLLLVASAVTACDARIPEGGRIPVDQLGKAGAGGDAQAATLSGTVLEQLPAGQYVYLRLKTGSGEVWAAVNAAPVTTGQQVTILNPMIMQGFESAALKRTFDAVYFGALSSAAASVTAGMNPHADGMQSAPAIDVGTVEKASGANGRTVAEAWAQKAALDGKTIAVRGVVVKRTEGVMGKTWLHLQDGSGDPALGTNDLTVATVSTGVALRETITVTGIVRTNMDIGAGYSFVLMVDDATMARK